MTDLGAHNLASDFAADGTILVEATVGLSISVDSALLNGRGGGGSENGQDETEKQSRLELHFV